MSLRRLLLGAVALAVCAATGCVPAAQSRQASTTTSISIGINTQLTTFDPARTVTGSELNIWHQVYDFLLASDQAEPRVRPWLAESWTTTPDGLTYTFKLKSGVNFHDGTPFDALAAQKNLQRLNSSATNANARSVASELDGISAPDPSTLVLRLKTPSAGFLTVLSGIPMASPTAMEQWGDDYGQHPVGTGPFELKEWVPQDRLVLERNPDYAWPPANSMNTGPAFLQTLTFKFIVDPPARLISLEANDVQGITYVPLQDAQRIASDTRFKVTTGVGPGMSLGLYLNRSDPRLANRDVREAIFSALDKDALIQIGGYGQPKPAAGLLTSASRCFSGGFGNVFPHNADHAKQLLDAAGWVPGTNGIREKNGDSLTLGLVLFPDYANLGATLQAQLREVGVGLDLKILDTAAGAALMRKGQVDAALVAPTINDPTGLTTNFHSRSIGTSVTSIALAPDASLDALLDRAAAEADSAGQCQAYDQFQQQFLSSAVAYPIWEVAAPFASLANISGVRMVPATGSMPMFQEVSAG